MYQPAATHVPGAGHETPLRSADALVAASSGRGGLTGCQRPPESVSITGVTGAPAGNASPTATQAPGAGQETPLSPATPVSVEMSGTAAGVQVPSDSVSIRPW